MEQVIKEGGITVTTKYPVYINNNKISPEDYYSNAFGDKATTVIGKVQKGVDTVKQSGAIELGQSIADIFSGKKSSSPSDVAPQDTIKKQPQPPAKEGVSKMTQYVLIAVGIGVVALLIYKNKKKK